MAPENAWLLHGILAIALTIACMEEGYWLRHKSLTGHQGPFKKKDLRPAIDSSAFPRDSEVLRDTGESEAQREGSNDWMPATELFEFAPVAGQASQARAQPADNGSQSGAHATPQAKIDIDRLNSLRRGSVYPNTRMLIQTGIVILVLAEAILMGLQMDAMSGTTLAATPLGSTPVFGALIAIIGTIAIGNVLLAVLDMADVAVRKNTPANGE